MLLSDFYTNLNPLSSPDFLTDGKYKFNNMSLCSLLIFYEKIIDLLT